MSDTESKEQVKESEAFKRFEDTVHRSLDLIAVHKSLDRRLGHHSELEKLELDDVLRAAVVLSVAGMDAYFTDVFLEKIEDYLKTSCSLGDGMMEIMDDAGIDVRLLLEGVQQGAPYDVLKPKLEQHFVRYVTQKFEVIDKLFLAYGLKNFTEEADRATDAVQARGTVRQLIRRRHDIVHQGDRDQQKGLSSICSKNGKWI